MTPGSAAPVAARHAEAKRKTNAAGRMGAAGSGLRLARSGRWSVILAVPALQLEFRLALVRRQRRQHDVDVAPDQLGLGIRVPHAGQVGDRPRSEEHTSELQSL